MKNNNDAIKQENKKALPKFLAIMAVCLVLGLALGYGLASSDIEDLDGALAGAGLFFTNHVAAWLLIALPLVVLAVCLPIYFGAKKQIGAWDGEDESVSNEVETKLSVCMWAVGLEEIASFFFLAAMISGFMANAGTDQMMPPAMFFGGVGAFLVFGLALGIVFQQKLVDAAKRLSPEKQGSVYDTKFSKKWLGSCDEAERAVIGQCAFKAYRATTYTCLVLWAVFGLGGMLFNWGFLPALAVCIIWGVSQSVYFYWALNLPKPGSPSVM